MKNKNYIIIIMASILLIFITGCSLNNNKKVTKSSYKPTIKTDLDGGSAQSSDLSLFFGEWNGVKRLITPRDYSEKELKESNIVGQKTIIKSDLFSDAGYLHRNPYYKISKITRQDFEKENIGSFIYGDLVKLKVHENPSIVKLDVYENKSQDVKLSTFYFQDKSTLVTISNYIAMYELKRIK
ncbi:MAG: hypothetical protein ACYC21_15285 [Eubacteriales bacterium]